MGFTQCSFGGKEPYVRNKLASGNAETDLIHCIHGRVVKTPRVFLPPSPPPRGAQGSLLPFLHDVHLQFLHLQLSPQVQVPPKTQRKGEKEVEKRWWEGIPTTQRSAGESIASPPSIH